LLAFGRKQHLNPVPISLNDLIVSGERIFRSLVTRNVELSIYLGEPAATVFVDPMQIHRVVVNLMTNARDAMPDGGKIVLSTGMVAIEPEDPSYPGVRPGQYAWLAVSDTGAGLTEEVRAHMFEPF